MLRLPGENALPRSNMSRDYGPMTPLDCSQSPPAPLQKAPERARGTIAPVKWFSAYSWSIAIRRRDPSSEATGDFTLIDNPRGHFYADPFIVEENGRVFLFVEDYSYLARSATLACLELNWAGSVIDRRTILCGPTHLSYPQIFSFDGTYYMIPETASADRVELYRAVDFPWSWKLDRILLDGVKLYDPTHCVIEDRHWIMAGGCSNSSTRRHDELHLFYSDSLHGTFRAHPGNPVKKDLGAARPGGAVMVWDTTLIRPAQDCRGWYGRGLTLMVVKRIDEYGYSEKPLIRIPDNVISGHHLGIHTFNASEHFEVIDVCHYGLKIPAFLGRARSLFTPAPRSKPIPRSVARPRLPVG